MANVVDDKANGGWTGTVDSAANAAGQLVAPAGQAGVRNRLWKLAISVSGAAIVADTVVTVKDGTTIIWKEFLGVGARGMIIDRSFDAKPLIATAGAAMTIDTAAGGAAVVITTNVTGDTKG